MPSPRQTFQNNIRPAELLLQVYQLLETNGQGLSEDQLLALRNIIHASRDEVLIVLYNELFLGLVREGAQVSQAVFRKPSLCHFLRQAVVASCTALDTYLPSLLRTNLPIVIRAVGRDFIPRSDQGVNEYLEDLTFSLDETLRLLDDPNAAEFISSRILNLANFSYLSSRKGIHVVGKLLGLSKPWDEIAEHLNRDKKDLMSLMDEAVKRRNDIVHRADRSQDSPDGEAQGISFPWTKQAVDTIENIVLQLDDLIQERIKEYTVV